jgi:KDO2-lipid IV(A) lauroyltransferase
MAKERSNLADFAVYLLVRVVVCCIQSLSLPMAYRLAEMLAWLSYRVDRRHRLVAAENLCRAFPERFGDAAACDGMVRDVYRHCCKLLVEIIHLPRRMHASTWRRYVELDNGKQIIDTLLSGRPVMIVTGHFGNWEMSGYILAMFGFRTHAIARPLDNPYLDGFLRQFRERTGQKLLAKKGDFDQMETILKSGGVLGTLGDQDAGQRGLFVDFFGRPASTHKAIALLSLEHQVPLMIGGARRIGEPLRYRTWVEDMVFPEDYAARPDAVTAITQRFTTALERIVRKAPAQYFWLHRRWKHQPAKARRKVA